MITRIWHGATPATKSDEYRTTIKPVSWRREGLNRFRLRLPPPLFRLPSGGAILLPAKIASVTQQSIPRTVL